MSRPGREPLKIQCLSVPVYTVLAGMLVVMGMLIRAVRMLVGVKMIVSMAVLVRGVHGNGCGCECARANDRVRLSCITSIDHIGCWFWRERRKTGRLLRHSATRFTIATVRERRHSRATSPMSYKRL